MERAAQGNPADLVAPGTALIQRLKGLPEAAMRVDTIAGELQNHDPAAAVWIIETIIRGALQKQPDYVAAYDSLVDPEPVAIVVGSYHRFEVVYEGEFPQGGPRLWTLRREPKG